MATVKRVETQFGVTDKMTQLAQLTADSTRLSGRIGILKSEIIAVMEGLRPEDLSTNQIDGPSYNRRSADDVFRRYPGSAAALMEDCVKACEVEAKAQHPIGMQLAAIDAVARTSEDNLTTVGTHRQLQDAWEQIQDALDMAGSPTTRPPRRVSIVPRTEQDIAPYDYP